MLTGYIITPLYERLANVDKMRNSALNNSWS